MVSSIKPIPPLSKELRTIILFYLAFLSMLVIFQTKVGRGQAVPAFTMPGTNGEHGQSLFRLQGWQSDMDRRMKGFFQKQGVEVEETTWILKEKNYPKPLQWTTTEFRIQWDEKRPMKDLAVFEKSLGQIMADFGGDRFFTDVCRLNHMTYYRFDYGIHWGSEDLVTHRLYVTKPERYPGRISQLGFSLKPRSRQITPEPQIDRIGLTTKEQILPTKPLAKEIRSEKKPDPDVQEVTAGLKRVNPLTTAAPAPQKPRVAIIIDDFGFVKESAEAYFRIHVPLTIAVLPGGEYSKEHALRASQSGFEVLLHQPLEPLNMERNNPGPGVIVGTDSEDRIREEFEVNLAGVPGAVGFNNHMGSAGTQNKRLMSILMSEAKKEGLFFIDSRAIANTVGEEAAKNAGVPHAGRRVFLDNDLGGIRKQLDILKMIAMRDGEAIGIAHARPGVAKAIENYLPEFEEAGIKIVYVSELVHR